MSVWSTWQRRPVIDGAIEGPLYRALCSKAQQLRCPVLALGGIADHVHVLARVHPSVPIARLIGEAKGYSSYVITHNLGRPFRWQEGYHATTITADLSSVVERYIRNQREHHRSGRIAVDLEPP